MNTQQTARPSVPMTDPSFVYLNSSQTDVQQTWRRFGWQPSNEQPVVVQHLPADDTEGGEL